MLNNLPIENIAGIEMVTLVYIWKSNIHKYNKFNLLVSIIWDLIFHSLKETFNCLQSLTFKAKEVWFLERCEFNSFEKKIIFQKTDVGFDASTICNT